MKVMRKAVLHTAVVAAAAMSGAAIAGDKHGSHWGYQGEGAPDKWAVLSDEFKTCGTGKEQSPIDISSVTVTKLDDIKVDYKPSALNVVNNGHTIQVNYDKGSTITAGDKTYELLQFHFHSPSEHTVGGDAADMVAHLVHKAEDGQLGVIGVLLDAADAENNVVKSVWEHMPKEKGEKTVADATINAADLLPKDMSYFNYSGSLTTPPCSEGVNWMVLAKRGTVSSDQVATFTEIFPLSVRPVQPINDRVVKMDN